MKEILELIKKLDFKGLILAPTENELLQFFRYCFVGGVATIVDWALLYFLTDVVGIHHLVSSVISFVGGLVTNFVISKLLVFNNSKAKVKPSVEFLGYAVIGIIGLGITELIMYVLTDCLHLHYMLSKAIATVVVLAWNYIARKKLLYKKAS